MKRLAIMIPAAALAMSGAAFAAPGVHAQTTGAPATAPQTLKAGSMTAHNPANMTRITGMVVDYLSYATGSGTRGPLMTAANNGAGSGATASGNGGGAPGGANARGNGGGSTSGGTGGGNGGILRPLGFLANGHVYLVDLPAKHAGLANVLSRNLGRKIALFGHVFTRNGADVIVVDAVE